MSVQVGVRQNSFTTFVNDLSDQDGSWGPLLFMRPPRHAPIGFFRSWALALLLGGVFGMLGNIVLALAARGLGRPIPPVYLMPAGLVLVYFLVCRLTVAAAWNRRARQLVKPF
jgi:hypothetical protein